MHCLLSNCRGNTNACNDFRCCNTIATHIWHATCMDTFIHDRHFDMQGIPVRYIVREILNAIAIAKLLFYTALRCVSLLRGGGGNKMSV